LIKVKEHNEEKLLKEQLKALEDQLQITQKKLQQTAAYNRELESILQGSESPKKSDVITIKSATKIEFVPIDDIVYCTADYGYTAINLINEKSITATKPLSTFELLLQEHTFFKISKSHIINTNHIITFYKDRNQILLKGDVLLEVSRRRRVEFLKTF
tara:strand:+ start:386 stop:859 length:474 start_codon:yes stop_codon:yes gene_type:complete